MPLLRKNSIVLIVFMLMSTYISSASCFWISVVGGSGTGSEVPRRSRSGGNDHDGIDTTQESEPNQAGHELYTQNMPLQPSVVYPTNPLHTVKKEQTRISKLFFRIWFTYVKLYHIQ